MLTTGTKRRAMKATRLIFSDDGGTLGGGPPIAWLEAIALEPVVQHHDAMIDEVARRIVIDANPTQAIGEIAAGFFNEPPVPTTAADPRPSDPTAPAPAASPVMPTTVDLVDDDAEQAIEDDDRRSLDEILRAADAIGRAVRMNPRARDGADRAAGMLADLALATKKAGDGGGAMRMSTAVAELRQSIEAAGTSDPKAVPSTEADIVQRNAEDAAARRGSHPDTVMRAGQLARDWWAFRQASGTSLTMEAYVESNLRREIAQRRQRANKLRDRGIDPSTHPNPHRP